MFRMMLVTVCMNVALAASASANGIQMFDQYGNYMGGNVNPGGHVEMFDTQGRFTQGHVSPGGHVDMIDQYGNYSSGHVVGGY